MGPSILKLIKGPPMYDNERSIELDARKDNGNAVDHEAIPPVLEIFSFNKSEAHQAAMTGSVSALRDMKTGNINLREVDDFGRLPIHDACLSGHPNVVKFFLEEVPNSHAMINAKDKMGMTPVHLACVIGNVPLLKLFLNHKGIRHFDEVDLNHKTAFQYAVENGNYACAYLLLEKRAKAKLAEINKLMAWAISLKLLSNAEVLFEKHNADLNTKGKSGLTLLELAIIEGEVKLVNKILESNTVSVEVRAKALVLASDRYEKAKLCKNEGFWTPAYTNEDKEHFNLIIKSLTKTFVETTDQKTEAPKIIQ